MVEPAVFTHQWGHVTPILRRMRCCVSKKNRAGRFERDHTSLCGEPIAEQAGWSERIGQHSLDWNDE